MYLLTAEQKKIEFNRRILEGKISHAILLIKNLPKPLCIIKIQKEIKHIRKTIAKEDKLIFDQKVNEGLTSYLKNYFIE